jgi:hypothetical protein
VALGLTACRHGGAASAPPAAAAPAAASAGCTSPLTGDWHHADDPGFRYHVEDDGRHVTASPRPPPGIETSNLPPYTIELDRGPRGLSGVTRVTDTFTFDGDEKDCTVEFQTRVVACSTDRLSIEMQQGGEVDRECHHKADPVFVTSDWIRD